MCACVAGVIAVAAPAAAQAFPEYWEVKPPATWGVLPPATPVGVKLVGSLAINGGKSGNIEYKSTCSVTAIEQVENQLLVGTTLIEGFDEMLSFASNCSFNGSAPYPCAAGENYSLSAISGWPSELIPNYDVFSGVSLQVTCAISGKTAVYKAPGGVWTGKLGTSSIVFPATGIFKHRRNFFYLSGTLKLKPFTPPYTAIR